MTNSQIDQVLQSNIEQLAQAEVPVHSLQEALQVPAAIAEKTDIGACQAGEVAAAVKLEPASPQFKLLLGSAAAYGLIEDEPESEALMVTDLASRIIRPIKEGIDLNAKREALLTPDVFNQFLGKYNNSPVPKAELAEKELISMGVPKGSAPEVLNLMLEEADKVGFISEIKGQRYVNLEQGKRGVTQSVSEINPSVATSSEKMVDQIGAQVESVASVALAPKVAPDNKRVYVSYSQNSSLIEHISKLLTFGAFEAEVSAESRSTYHTNPEKVIGDMRECGAAIIHVEKELILLDEDNREHIMLAPNVIMEICAAMALFKNKFILLVKEGVKMPTNLKNFHEVRYSGDTMDGDATVRLLEAIMAMKAESEA